MSRFINFSIIALILCVSVGCGCSKKNIELESIVIDYLNSDEVSFEYLPDGSTNLIVDNKGSFNVLIEFSPKTVKDKEVICYSDDSNIAEMVKGKITAKNSGTTSIYCENPKTGIKSNTVNITVK